MSKIEVDQITQQSGTTLTVGGGACKTANIDATTVTIGKSGGTVSLASGATQSGFGRSGSVDWQTTPKTATFTAASGEGYFINSGSALTMNLPAGSAGAIVAVSDYARNFATYNLTIAANGSEKIGGQTGDATLNVNGQAATLVYVDGTKGWVNVQNAEDTETGAPPYLEATGGTITEDGNFKVHTFTSPGTFTVTKLATESPAPAHNIVSYVVVGAGGSGGGTGGSTHVGAGGGAGGFREGKNAPIDSYTASPLNAPAGLPVAATGYPITIGAGGAHPGTGPQRGGNGNATTFAGSSTITSAGGGGGGSLGSPGSPPCRSGNPGGSGGGGSSQVAGAGGSGNSPPVSPPQGQDGAQGVDSPPDLRGGGGGGATAAGTQGSPPGTTGRGGAGATTNISGSPVGYSGGGGGGATSASGPGNSQASPCGSGAAGGPSCGPSAPGSAATANRGGGGGGAGGAPSGPSDKLGGTGGSGVVILRYKFQ